MLFDSNMRIWEHVFRSIPSSHTQQSKPIAYFIANEQTARVAEVARKTFGDPELAHEWLTSANPALQNQIPIEVARTQSGAREVEAVLTRFAHGDYT
jgi:putative toxin-antitoxin system antitoxin component (TIGR02293 family)